MEKQQNKRSMCVDQNSQTKQKGGSKDYIALRIKGPLKDDPTQSLLQLEHYSSTNYFQYVKQLSLTPNPSYEYETPELLSYLKLGMNLCFYGVGSKINFLHRFIKSYFPDRYVWEIRGYLPSINDKKVYNNFGIFLIEANIAQSIHKISMKDLLEEYHTLLSKVSTKIIVIFHCLDGINFFSAEAQKKLSSLFSLPNVQLIASIENCKIIKYWSPSISGKYKFFFFNINTNLPTIRQQYHKQHTMERKDTTEKSLINIWKCLNFNQRMILRIIAGNELENMNREEPIYLTISDILEKCIQEMIFINQTQIRSNLLELLDHKVILERTDDKRFKKVFTIKYEKRILEIILSLKSE